jgi:hypothetical protein
MKLRVSTAARPGRSPVRRQLGVFVVLLGLTASGVLAVGVTQVSAVVVDATPTWPIPTDATVGPPPIPAMPAATDTVPPADQIVDPVTPTAACGGWYLQTSYGGRWVAATTWWEYRCSHDEGEYHNTCPGPACNAFCPDCYWESREWTDYFFWDGSNARFYGQAYLDSFLYDGEYSSSFAYWWDGAMARWYALGPYFLGVSKAGNGSGTVSSSPAGISCGDTCQATFDAGTSVSLTAIADTSSILTGWSGDCSGTGSCQVTIDRNHSVTAAFTLKAFSVTVSKAGTGSGAVTSSPAGITCGDTCQATFDAGTSVALTAAPDASSIFTGWSGDCSGIGSCHVTVDGPRSMTAAFDAIIYRPDALIRSSSTSPWTGGDVYSPGGTGETVSSGAARGTTATFYIAAENDGNVGDALTVAGPGSVKGFAVHYYDAATDVTASVVQGTYSTGLLAPGTSRVIRMTVAIGHNVRPGTVNSWLMTVTSREFTDGVNAVVNVG